MELKIKEPKYEEVYPPVGTPDTALVSSLDGDYNYTILGHTGRYFFGMCVEAGYCGEESGISNPPEEPGYWVMEGGGVWTSTDWESGLQDDYGIEGDWRRATMVDFIKYDADYPLHLTKVGRLWYRILELFVKPFGSEMTGDVVDLEENKNGM